MQKAFITARLTKDPKSTENGCTYGSLAVARPIKKEGAPDTDFFDFVAFSKTGEFIQKYCKQGNLLAIEGRFENQSYKDKEGNQRTKTQLIIERVENCTPKSTTSKADEADEEEFAPDEPFTDDDDEDIPFN